MKLTPAIIDMLARRAGHELRLPADCERLALDIQSRTGQRVGATTLKRLLGFATDERMPHATTLDILALYLGYSHWQQLKAIADQGNSGFDSADCELRSASLAAGSMVEFTYLPDRRVRLRYLGDNHYCVVESVNSSLCEDDEVTIQSFVEGHPLYVADVHRQGQSLGPFTAGRIAGLQTVVML